MIVTKIALESLSMTQTRLTQTHLGLRHGEARKGEADHEHIAGPEEHGAARYGLDGANLRIRRLTREEGELIVGGQSEN